MKETGLSKNIENAIKSDELASLGLDFTEIAIDQFLNDGLLKDIPLVNSITAIFKTGASIRDALFIKKVLIFISTIQEIDLEKRKTFLLKLNEIKENKFRLFEKLIFTIDKIDESKKMKLLGKVFKHLIVGNIDLIQYFRICRVIEDMLLDEINFFFYEYGHYEHNDKTREILYSMYGINTEDFKQTMIRNGLFRVREELEYWKNIVGQKYKMKKIEELTDFGKLFCEFGFKPWLKLKNPIN